MLCVTQSRRSKGCVRSRRCSGPGPLTAAADGRTRAPHACAVAAARPGLPSCWHAGCCMGKTWLGCGTNHMLSTCKTSLAAPRVSALAQASCARMRGKMPRQSMRVPGGAHGSARGGAAATSPALRGAGCLGSRNKGDPKLAPRPEMPLPLEMLQWPQARNASGGVRCKGECATKHACKA